MTLVAYFAALVFTTLRLMLKTLRKSQKITEVKGHSKSMSKPLPSIKFQTVMIIALLASRCCAFPSHPCFEIKYLDTEGGNSRSNDDSSMFTSLIDHDYSTVFEA